MRRNFTLILIIAFSSGLGAQFYDNHWMFGYAGGDITPSDDSFGISIVNFYNADLRIENNQEIDISFDGSSSSLSNFDGDLFLYSNNLEIRNVNDQIITNGFFEESGDPEQILPQSFVYLPFESLDIIHYVQMTYTDDFPRLGREISSYIISDTGENLGIYEEFENVLTDSLSTSQLTACRHANGRDWWVLVAAAHRSRVYSTLISPYGITLVDTTEVAFEMQSGLGQSVFSPNGEKFIQINLVGGPDTPDYLDVFDFDRCSGELSNHRQTTLVGTARSGGVAVSPSSEFLYVTRYNHIFQYDLLADDVFAIQDTVATYDGYTEWDFFNSRFYLAHLAPNGEIYVNSPSGVKTLTVIKSPDQRGVACDVQQHSIALPNNNATTLANHPNYRLGPIDGSPADTLGIDNLPRAYFRTDRDTEDTLAFHFQDLSFYEPTNWSWSFGDGGVSDERHPNYSFSSPGIYEVCLTVTNALGNNTHCRTIELGPVGVDDLRELKFRTFPNPFQDVLVFDLGDYLPINGRLILYDALGREVFSEQILYRQASFNLRHLVAGSYYYSFWDGGRKLGQGKIIRAN
jgi:hypothetical protein